MSLGDIGPLDERDLPALRGLMGLAFGATSPESQWERESSMLELGRSLSIRDDDRLVAHAAAFSFTMSIPSGRTMPVAGVTWVGVSPAYRRQGLLRRLMTHQLTGLAQGTEPVAALWASEPSIYGRFGYGLGSREVRLTVPRAFNQTDGRSSGGLTLEVSAIDEALAARCAAIYANGVLDRPGIVYRNDAMTAAAFSDPPDERHGASELRCILVRDDTQDLAYATYSVKVEWPGQGAASEVHVREFVALTPAAHRRVMGCLLDLDLTGSVHMTVPVDDPLLVSLQHLRRATPTIGDQMWVRILDLPSALTERSYGCDVDLVLDVRDSLLESNMGRWRLRGGEDGAECVPTKAEPDLSMDIRELGAAFLGDATIVPAAGAGLIDEHRPGSVTRAARAFGHEPRPFISFVF